jgi:hypothetical protein
MSKRQQQKQKVPKLKIMQLSEDNPFEFNFYTTVDSFASI